MASAKRALPAEKKKEYDRSERTPFLKRLARLDSYVMRLVPQKTSPAFAGLCFAFH